MNRPIALVTGGARRVGRAIALHLGARGYDLVITYNRSGAEAQLLCSELNQRGGQAFAIHADLTEGRSASARIAAELATVADRLQALINNASIYLPDSSVDSMLPMYQVHCEAPLLLSRLLAPHLRANRGCIINMCDILGDRPMRGWLGYCSSKAALANITRGLARELAPEVRVCGIAPGVVQWPDDYDDAAKEQYLQRVPLKRAGTPEEVAALVHFLLTEGTYITGQIIPIDGGRSIA